MLVFFPSTHPSIHPSTTAGIYQITGELFTYTQTQQKAVSTSNTHVLVKETAESSLCLPSEGVERKPPSAGQEESSPGMGACCLRVHGVYMCKSVCKLLLSGQPAGVCVWSGSGDEPAVPFELGCASVITMCLCSGKMQLPCPRASPVVPSLSRLAANTSSNSHPGYCILESRPDRPSF